MTILTDNEHRLDRLLRRASRVSAESRDLIARADTLLEEHAALMDAHDELAASVLDAGRAVVRKASLIVRRP